MKHTPGPWSIESTTGPDIHRKEIVAGDDRSVLAEVFGDDLDDQCWPISANARLIAAAPELLAALQAIYSEWNSRTALVESCDFTPAEANAIQMVEAAIAKTEGSL